MIEPDDRWISVGGLRSLVRAGKKFDLICERANVGRQDGRPCYIVKIVCDGHVRTITTSMATRGIKPRLFSLWPGLVRFVGEFGDDNRVALDLKPDVASLATAGGESDGR